jgi:hypothetical protein
MAVEACGLALSALVALIAPGWDTAAVCDAGAFRRLHEAPMSSATSTDKVTSNAANIRIVAVTSSLARPKI